MIRLLLTPWDTVFFRSGRPFNTDDPGAAHAESLFPPNPTTVAGAVRLALAECMGRTGRKWDAALLGDYEQPGSIRIRGPYLVREQADGCLRRLYPAPAILVGRPRTDGTAGQWDTVHRLEAEPTSHIVTDLGPQAILATTPHEDARPLSGAWLTQKGMEAVLAGGAPAPEDVVPAAALWNSEPRIGLELVRETRTARESHLYAARHVRPAVDLRLMVEVEGWDRSLAKHPLPRAVALGGEGRSAWLEEIPGDRATALKAPSPVSGRSVIAITPVLLGATDILKPGVALTAGGPMIKTVCCDKAVGIGGWNGATRQPLPMRPALPAGATWFLDGDVTATSLPRHLGDLGGWGYGEVLIGA